MSHPPPHARRRVVEAPARRPPTDLQSVRVVFEEDPDPEISFLEQDEFEERLEAYRRGDFTFVSCHVEADIRIAETTQTLRSNSLGGIESDSEQEYLDEIIAEEWSQLRAVLKAVGIPTDKLPLEVDRAWIEWRT